jgi:MFS family permease
MTGNLIDTPEPDLTSGRVKRVIWCALGLAALSGAMIGVVAASTDDPGDGMTTIAWVVLGLMAAGLLALLVRLALDLRYLFQVIDTLPRAERVSIRFITIAMLAGVAGGISGVVVNEGTHWFEPGATNLPPMVALGLAALLLTIGPWRTWVWWTQIDEHEQAAYAEGANIAGHFVLFAGMAWWVLSKAALVPSVDGMALILAMCFVWTGVWLYRKFS